jgi:putative RecB family exonuclease
MNKPHLSQSQLDTFCKCPEAWRRRYLEGHRIPPGIAALKGSGVHKAAEINFRQKIETHEDLPLDEFREAAADGFDHRVSREDVALTPEESSRGRRLVLAEAKDATVAMAEFHAENQAPEYQPELVEARVRILLSGKHDLLAVIDLADDQRRIVDFKNGKRRFSQEDVDGSVQFTAYAAAYQGLKGEPPSSLVQDCIVTTAKGPTRQRVETAREPADFRALGRRIEAVSSAIEAGVFPPAPPGAWWCSAAWCGYHRTCPYVSKRS